MSQARVESTAKKVLRILTALRVASNPAERKRLIAELEAAVAGSPTRLLVICSTEDGDDQYYVLNKNVLDSIEELYITNNGVAGLNADYVSDTLVSDVYNISVREVVSNATQRR